MTAIEPVVATVVDESKALGAALIGAWKLVSFTHLDEAGKEIAGPFGAVYYLGGPQQARPPEGRFKPGTRVRLVRKNGSYSVVQSENGITAHVATGALKAIGE